MIHFRCPSCNDQLSVPDGQAGQSEKCPNCGSVAMVPTGAPVANNPTLNNATLNVKLPDNKPTSGLGIAALVMGILAALTCWIPIVGMLGIPVSALGLLFAFIGLLIAIVGKKSGIGMPIAGGIVCGIAIAIAISVTGATATAVDHALTEMVKADKDASVSVSTGKADAGTKKSEKSRAESLIEVRLVKAEKGDYSPTLTFEIKNISGKDIAALKGGVQVYDQFGDHMTGLSLGIDEKIAAGASVQDSGSWSIDSRAEKLLTTQADKLKIVYRVMKILYTDGTNETF